MNTPKTLLFLHVLSEQDRRKLESFFSEKEKALLRFDGIYACPDTGRFYDYLCFEKNGKVHRVSSNGTPDQIASWIKNPEKAAVWRGTYKISGSSHISFSLRDKNDFSMENNGTIEKDRLVLDVNSVTYGDQKMGQVYRFRDVDAWK